MIKDLIKLANELDRRGLTKEADALDRIVASASGTWQTQEVWSHEYLRARADRPYDDQLTNKLYDFAQALEKKFAANEGGPDTGILNIGSDGLHGHLVGAFWGTANGHSTADPNAVAKAAKEVASSMGMQVVKVNLPQSVRGEDGGLNYDGDLVIVLRGPFSILGEIHGPPAP